MKGLRQHKSSPLGLYKYQDHNFGALILKWTSIFIDLKNIEIKIGATLVLNELPKYCDNRSCFNLLNKL